MPLLVQELPEDEFNAEFVGGFEPDLEEAEEEPEITLDEDSASFLHDLILRILTFLEYFCDEELYPYQRDPAYRLIESVLLNDGDEVTVLMSRQAGKSTLVADVIATLMVLLPRLAKQFEMLAMFRKGFQVGVFGPIAEQAETIWGRVKDRLQSERAKEIFADPEIDDKTVSGGVRTVRLRECGSFCRYHTANPKAKIESKSYHWLVLDECFPAETPVLTTEGWVPIGEIVQSERRDWVVATQDTDGSLGWGRVRTTYRTPRHTPLVRVDHEHGSVYATANHPFMVDGQAVPAIALTPGTLLSVVPGAPQPRGRVGEAGQDLVLLQSAQSTLTQPDGGPRGMRANAGNPTQDWAPPQGAGRQWSRTDRATAKALGRAWDGMGGRACLPYWQSSDGGPTDLLQDRHRTSGRTYSNRSGRPCARWMEASSDGSAQEPVARGARVVRVEVLESGSPEFDQFSDGADFVYTLEVESASHTYIAGGVLVGNCQDIDDYVAAKSIFPMGAHYNASRVLTGTPNRTKNLFYKAIQRNKRRDLNGRRRKSHYEYNWRIVSKYNAKYKAYVEGEIRRLGPDSDEVQLSYECRWLLDRGMFTTESVLEEVMDPSMRIVQAWWQTPVVVGVDPARTKDSTVVTVLWVDWDTPDDMGYYDCRILNWLEIHNEEWETQYAYIAEFLAHYNIWAMAVDAQGVGGAVAERLKLMMAPRGIEVHLLGSDQKAQHERWTHLSQMLERRKIIIPGHSKARRVKVWKKFFQQMTDLEKVAKGPYILAQAPDEEGAYDDYCDSLALACVLTKDVVQAEAEQIEAPWFSRR